MTEAAAHATAQQWVAESMTPACVIHAHHPKYPDDGADYAVMWEPTALKMVARGVMRPEEIEATYRSNS